jgi:hypothetical protein
MSHLAIDDIELSLVYIKSPDSNRIIVNSYKFVRVCIKIANVLTTLVRLV